MHLEYVRVGEPIRLPEVRRSSTWYTSPTKLSFIEPVHTDIEETNLRPPTSILSSNETLIIEDNGVDPKDTPSKLKIRLPITQTEHLSVKSNKLPVNLTRWYRLGHI